MRTGRHRQIRVVRCRRDQALVRVFSVGSEGACVWL